LNNPVWDLGLQFMFAKTNNEKVFTSDMENIQTYANKCVCPCSSIFSEWHRTEYLDQLPGWHPCEGCIFKEPMEFIHHLHDICVMTTTIRSSFV